MINIYIVKFGRLLWHLTKYERLWCKIRIIITLNPRPPGHHVQYLIICSIQRDYWSVIYIDNLFTCTFFSVLQKNQETISIAHMHHLLSPAEYTERYFFGRVCVFVSIVCFKFWMYCRKILIFWYLVQAKISKVLFKVNVTTRLKVRNCSRGQYILLLASCYWSVANGGWATEQESFLVVLEMSVNFLWS